MNNQSLSKYYSRIQAEAFIKSALYGMLVGFGSLILSAALYWIFGWKSVWICAVVFGVISVASAFVIYRLKYRLTVKRVASRVDELGLEERILTMIELEGEDSFMAKMQREDAVNALKSVEPELIPIKVSLSFFIKFASVMLVALICAAVAVLTAVGIIPSLKGLIESGQEGSGVTTYDVVYGIRQGEGKILGEAEQEVIAGESASPVAAVAADGWVFVRWTDQYGNAYRIDENITANLSVYAVFEVADTGTAGDLPEDQPDDAPGQPGEENSNDSSSDDYGDEVNGKFEEVNQVINGEIYYGNVFGESYAEALEKLVGSDYSEEEKSVGNGYFESIDKSEQK